MEKLEDLIVRYGVVAGRRFYEREKIRFLMAIAEEFQQSGYQVEVKKATSGQFKAYNLYIGDLTKADTIITTYYDTPAKTFGSSSYKVFSKKTLPAIFSTSVPMLICTLLGILFIVKVAEPVWSDQIFQLGSLAVGMVVFILLRGVVRYRRGMGNRFNLVRNTSSVLALLSYAKEVSPEDQDKFAVALTDFGCVNHLGEEIVKTYLDESHRSKKFVMLDCIGSYHELILMASTRLKNKAIHASQTALNKAVKILNLDDGKQYKPYDNSLVITSGTLINDEVIVDKVNTRKDDDLNIENIYQTVELLKAITGLATKEKV